MYHSQPYIDYAWRRDSSNHQTRFGDTSNRRHESVSNEISQIHAIEWEPLPLRFSRAWSCSESNRRKWQNGFILFSACGAALFLLTLSVCSISAIIRRCLFLCPPRRKSPHKQLLLILQKKLLIIDGTTYGSAEQVYSLFHPSSPLRLVSFLQSPAHPLVPTVDNASETTFANVPSDTLDLVVLRVCSFILSSFSYLFVCSSSIATASSCDDGNVTTLNPLFSITFGSGSATATHHKHQQTSASPPPTHRSLPASLKMDSSPSWMLYRGTATLGKKVDSTTHQLTPTATCSWSTPTMQVASSIEPPSMVSIVGSQYYLSAYLTNIVKKDVNLLRPDVTFQVRAATGNALLRQASTGPIPETATLQWQQYGMIFVAPSTSVVLVMISTGGWWQWQRHRHRQHRAAWLYFIVVSRYVSSSLTSIR